MSEVKEIVGHIVVFAGMARPEVFPLSKDTTAIDIDGRKFRIVFSQDSVAIGEGRVEVESTREERKATLCNLIKCRKAEMRTLSNEIYQATWQIFQHGLAEKDREEMQELRSFKEAIRRQHDAEVKAIEAAGREFSFVEETRTICTANKLKNGVRSQVDKYTMMYIMDAPAEVIAPVVREETKITECTARLTDLDLFDPWDDNEDEGH